MGHQLGLVKSFRPSGLEQIVRPHSWTMAFLNTLCGSYNACISASVAVSEANWTSVTNFQLMGGVRQGCVLSPRTFHWGFAMGPCASGAPKWKVKVSALKCRTECRDCWI